MSYLSNTNDRPGRIDALDGLRGVAALTVIGNHWELTPTVFHAAQPGFMLFFAISAFLQTRNLLRRRAATPQRADRLSALRTVHLRRWIRVLPVVWFVLILTAIVGVSDIRDALLWHLAFLSNVLLAVQQEWPETATVFWSTSALEQFYLVWPAVVLLLPLRWLPRAMVAMIAFAFLFRVGVIDLTGNYFIAKTLPFGVCDALAAGALTAWATERSPALMQRLVGWALAATVVSLALWLAVYLGAVPGLTDGLNSSLRILLMTIPCSLLVTMLVAERWAPVSRALRRPVLRELGAISLGLFLWHQFAWALVDGAGLPHALTALVALPLTIIAAWLTYRLVEQPLDRAKRRVGAPSAQRFSAQGATR